MAAGGGDTVQVANYVPQSFYGHEIVQTPTMPTSTRDLADSVALFFGDLRKGVAFGDRRTLRLKVDESKYLDTDEIAIQATERYDIVCHDLGDASTAGPVAALELTA